MQQCVGSKRLGLVISAGLCHQTKDGEIHILQKVQLCPGFSWDIINFLQSSRYGTVFWT